jgi:hypothetical protein
MSSEVLLTGSAWMSSHSRWTSSAVAFTNALVFATVTSMLRSFNAIAAAWAALASCPPMIRRGLARGGQCATTGPGVGQAHQLALLLRHYRTGELRRERLILGRGRRELLFVDVRPSGARHGLPTKRADVGLNRHALLHSQRVRYLERHYRLAAGRRRTNRG